MAGLSDERSVHTNFFSSIKVIYGMNVRLLEAENNLEEKLEYVIY